MNQQIEEAESNIASLEERENALIEQVEALETKLLEKNELAKHLAELGRLGFDSENLTQLQETLRVIGAKHGLKGKEVVNKFFDDLKDYGAVLEAEAYLNGLQTQIETRKLEAENWQAKEEVLRRKHDDLKEDIAAVHALRKRGIKAGQIITWNKILSRFETAEQFEQSLMQYVDITGVLNSKKEEIKNNELRLIRAQSQMETVEKERARIEGVIDAFEGTVNKGLKAMAEESIKQSKTLAETEKSEIRAVGQEVRAEFMDYLARFETSNQKAFETGRECERMEQRLQKYEGIKNVLDSHAAASEGENEVPEQP